MIEFNIIMPMAGKGLRLADAGFEKPKPLVEIKNKPSWNGQLTH